jgi:uncharacterized membrane protein
MYSALKLIHVIAVIVFLGNIFTGLFWMSLATRDKNVQIITHTIQGIIKSDRWFTIPGVIIITASGMIAAVHGGLPLLRTGWIFWSIVMFTVSGIVFVWRVAPLQSRINRLLSGNGLAENAGFFWNQYDTCYKSWEAWGAVAIITPVLALCMMVLKFPAHTFFLK